MLSEGEAELVRRTREGDQSALEKIYEQCQPAVFRYIYYRVGNTAVAEELTGEVFVRLVQNLPKYQDRGRPILAWLYTIARNLVIDYQRHNSRVTWLPLDDGLRAGEETHPGRIVESRQEQAELLAALDQLTETQRQVVILKFMEARSNAEVAAILGKDEGAVKSLQHRALAALRRVLGGSQPEVASVPAGAREIQPK